MKNIENISDTLAERFGVSKQDSKIFTEGVFKEISNCLVNNKEEVRIKNFGTFKFGKSAGRTTKHPVTKETIVIEENTTIRFKASTKLKNNIHESSYIIKYLKIYRIIFYRSKFITYI